ncbi:MAG TPA: SpoIIE family protein phosphatase [Frankiaceae bacterium]|jgi:serine phosphatase RsbU (regulator of sigma subunit)|nr:SpoIIE family protein phosphatase [Frankiaceae bacterium]
MIGLETRLGSGRNAGTAPDALAPLLLVEDDEGDAFLVTELLLEAGIDWPVEWVRNLSEAATALASGVRCVLLDLGLPDADDRPDGLGALHDLLEIAPLTPVLVLTGLDDEARGAAAVFAGAQDYLVKGQVDGNSLARAVLYAVERRRAEEASRQLMEARLLQGENDRLTRGLLPQPQLRSPDLFVHSRYTPGERRLVLGGDFYDVVEGADGRLHLLVGDVSGHGPDEAALGVHLRVAWRTLVLAEVPSADVLPILEDILVRERRSDEIFATVCQLVISADRARGALWLAGHPVPILLEPHCRPLADEADGGGTVEIAGPPLGAVPGLSWDRVEVALPVPWALALHSDGLFEGFADAQPAPDAADAGAPVDAPIEAPIDDPVGGAAEGRPRLGLSGLLDILITAQQRDLDDSTLLDTVITEAERRNGGPMADDLALLMVRHDPRSGA